MLHWPPLCCKHLAVHLCCIIANEPLPGSCASQLKLVYAFSTSSCVGSGRASTTALCHWCCFAWVYIPILPSHLLHSHKLCATAMANASKCCIKACLIGLHTQSNTQGMVHALLISHPCVAAWTLMAKCIAQAHTDIRRLEFLPYHFLLGSVGDLGVLRFQVSICHRCISPCVCSYQPI